MNGPKFITDGMLGKLSRWLRLAGYDVVYVGDLALPPEEQDEALVSRAKAEGRMLLTCDIDLHRRARKLGTRSAFIQSGDVVEQLAELSRKIGHRIEIKPENSRCPLCNGELEEASPQEVRGKIPEGVAEVHQEFWRCSSCGKIYWQGTHWQTIVEMAQRYRELVG